MTNKITASILSVAHNKDDLFETTLRFFGLASEDISEDVKTKIAPRIETAQRTMARLRKEMGEVINTLNEAGIYTESVTKKVDNLAGHGKEAAELATDHIDKLHNIATLTENLAFVLQGDNQLASEVLKGLIQSREARQAALSTLTDEEAAKLQNALNRETTRRRGV